MVLFYLDLRNVISCQISVEDYITIIVFYKKESIVSMHYVNNIGLSCKTFILFISSVGIRL